MKNLIFLLFIAAFSTASLNAQEKTTGKMLRHVVLFKFKDDASKEGVKKLEDAFRQLPSKIKEIKAFEWGTNNSPENLNNGFTHCFFVTFGSEQDRDAYLPHPAHKAFVDIAKDVVEKALVVDYWVKD